jgi:Tfp pilus assembly protein PilO
MNTRNIKNDIERITFYDEIKKYPLTGPSISFLATFLLVIMLFLLAIQPTLITIGKLNKQIENFEKIKKELQIKKQTLDELLNSYSLIESQLYLVDEAMPEGTNFDTLEKQIRYLVQENNLGINSLAFSGFSLYQDDEKEKSGNKKEKAVKKEEKESPSLFESDAIQTLSISLSVSGTYDNIKKFLQMSSDTLRLVTINSVNFQKQNKRGRGNDPIAADIRATVYYYKEINLN